MKKKKSYEPKRVDANGTRGAMQDTALFKLKLML